MKRLLLVVVLACSACHLSQPLTKAQVQTILVDAGYGVEVGCVAQWLDTPTCALAHRILDDAQLAVSIAATNGWQTAAKAVLTDEESRLSADSKLRPYIDAAIILL